MPRSSLPIALLAAVAALGLAGSARAAQTAVFHVRVCDEAHFRSAVAAATGRPDAAVRFACDGTITLTPQGGGTVQVIDPTPTDELTIDGSGHSVAISGGKDLQTLWFAGPHVTLRHLTIEDGSDVGFEGTRGGGAIFAVTPLLVDHVTLRGNHAYNGGGAIKMFGASASLDVRNSRLEDNSVLCTISSAGIAGGGGAINVQAGGPTTISNSVLEDNTADGNCVGGGAVLAPRSYQSTGVGPVHVEASRFAGNVAQVVSSVLLGGGGALAVYNRPLTIAGSTFTRNGVESPIAGVSTLASGGAVRVDDQTDGLLPELRTRIVRTAFDRNGAADDATLLLGGGLGLRDVQSTPAISASTFVGDRARRGGGIYAATSMTVEDTVFSGDVADERGGALFVGSRKVVLRNVGVYDSTPDACSADGSTALLRLHQVFESPGASCAAVSALPSPPSAG